MPPTLPFRSSLAGVLLIAAACRPTPSLLRASASPDSSLLATDVRFLANDSLEGRATGSAGFDRARTYVARRFRDLQLKAIVSPANCGAPPCRAGFEQTFTARPTAASRNGIPAELPTANLVAAVEGTDPALRSEWIVIGAHLDHLGRWSFNSLDPEAQGAIRNGADDNASGVATVLELARLLRTRPVKRSVAVAVFSGEELGLLGSAHFVDNPPFPLANVQAMLNFDMVGRLRDDKLMVYGTATATEMAGIVNAANVAPAFRLIAIGDGTGPSDHASFYLKNLPVLHFFTDLHDDYHRSTDDSEKINTQGMTRVVAMAERIVRTLGDRPSRLTFVRTATTASVGVSSRSGTGSQAYLGSIPDMGAGDIRGLRLSGIRPGSPADAGGLKAGDIIIELGGKAVTDLYTYTDALYAHQPGETVKIVVMRGSERVSVSVTLGKRGG